MFHRHIGMARFNSLGYLELSINAENASKLLGLFVGSNVQVLFE